MKSIKTSVWVRVIAAIVSLLLLGSVLAARIVSIGGARDDIAAAERISSTAYAAEVAHYKWSSNLSNAVYAGTDFTGSVEDTGCVLGKWLYGEAGTTDQEILSLMTQIKPLHKEIHASAEEIVALHKTSPMAAQSQYQGGTADSIAQLVGLLDKVVARGDALVSNSNDTMAQDIRLLIILAAICIVLVVICLTSLTQYVMRHIVQPVIHITKESSGLADGVLQFRVEIHGNNEIAQLADSLERSVEEISGYVHDIDKAMGMMADGNFDIKPAKPFIGDFKSIETAITNFAVRFSDTLVQIGQAASQVSGGADQISSTSQALAQGATEQASAVQELSATINEIAISARRNAEAARGSKEQSLQAGAQVDVCAGLMKEMVAAMDNISGSSQEIGKIIATIENIAFQTNILALNAAVEAARAGTAGKGFAVVADEVRNLASKSDQAAKATKELIEGSVNAVKQGSEIVGGVSEALQKTIELAGAAVNGMGVITTAVDAEAQSIAQVTEGIEQISSVVQTNSASAEESAAASEELFAQARLMKELLSRFQLRDDAAGGNYWG